MLAKGPPGVYSYPDDITPWKCFPQYWPFVRARGIHGWLRTMDFPLLTTNSSTHQQRASHYNDVIMSAMASQVTSLTIVYSTVYSGADQRKHQSSASLAFMRGIHRWPVNSPHKRPVMRKMFTFDDVIIFSIIHWVWCTLRKLAILNCELALVAFSEMMPNSKLQIILIVTFLYENFFADTNSKLLINKSHMVFHF